VKREKISKARGRQQQREEGKSLSRKKSFWGASLRVKTLAGDLAREKRGLSESRDLGGKGNLAGKEDPRKKSSIEGESEDRKSICGEEKECY